MVRPLIVVKFFTCTLQVFLSVKLDDYTEARKDFWDLLFNCFDDISICLKTYSRVSNRRGGRNKRGGWQISAKIINGKLGKNLQG